MSFMDRIVRPIATLRKRAAASRGQAAEDVAASFLLRQGIRVVGRNFRVRGGEIDLICEDGATLVFVEVRLRGSQRFGGAAASITPRKQKRLILAARHWLSQQGDTMSNRNCRFDCVLMDAPEESRIEWIMNAFMADY